MEFSHTGLFVPTDESTLLLGAASPSLKEICQVRAVLGPPRSDKQCEILLLPTASKSLADFHKAMVILRNYMNLLIKHHWSIDSDRVKAVTFCELNSVKTSNGIDSKRTDSVKTSSSAVTSNESAIAPVRSNMNRLMTVQMKNKNDNICNGDSTHNQKLDKLKENKIPSLPILTGCTSSKRSPAPIRKTNSNTDLCPSKSKKRKFDKTVKNKSSSSMLSTLVQGDNAGSSNGVVNIQELQKNRIENLMKNKIISQDRRTVLLSPCFELFTVNNSEKSTIVHSAKSTASSSSANVVTNVKQQSKTSIIGIETRKTVTTICTNNKTISISQPRNTNVPPNSDKLLINDSISNVEVVNLIDDDEALSKTNTSCNNNNNNNNHNNNAEILCSSSNNVRNFSSSKNTINTMLKDNKDVIFNNNTNGDDDDIIICSDNISIKDSEEELFGDDDDDNDDVEEGECTDVNNSDEDIVLILNDSDNDLESDDDITILPNNKSCKPRRCNRLKEDINRISDLSESDVLIDENVSVIEIGNDESKDVILISENEENVNIHSNNSRKLKNKRQSYKKKLKLKRNKIRELRKMNRQELLEQGYTIKSQEMRVRKKSKKSTEVHVSGTNQQESSHRTVTLDPVWVPPAHFASQYQNLVQTGPAPMIVSPYQMPTTSFRTVFNVTGVVPNRSITTGAASSSKTPNVTDVGTNVCMPDDNKEVEKTGLRPVIIDASNVAFSHGMNSDFSFRGIEICVRYFKTRGHKVIAFLPNYRKSCINNNILNTWENDGTLVFTPSRKVNNSLIISHDDRYIIQCAAALGGIIVSKDNYRDFMGKNPIWDEAIKNRLLMFTFVGDLLMFPEDPLGRCGPTLDEFLRFPPS